MTKKTDKLFRYIEKYVGTYRVLPELDPTTSDFPKDAAGRIPDSYEDFYIPCSKGDIRHTYEEGILQWRILDRPATGHNVYDALRAKFGKTLWLKLDDFGSDVIILFKESDLDKIADIVKPKTNGKRIPPLSSKNLPRANYKIPEADLQKLQDLLQPLDKKAKMLSSKQWIKDFDNVIQKKKGKKFNITEQRDDSGLKNKEFIHSIGLWDDYCRYVKKQIKELTK